MIKLYTDEEVIDLLRIDVKSIKDPKATLKHLRRTGQLSYVKVAGRVRYRELDLENFINRSVRSVKCN